jgi:leucyl-tRNA---protein transferase
VARLLRQFIEEERECSYLSEKKAQLEYRLLVDVMPDELESMLVRGWRRFGPAYFRPACASCQGCDSLRLNVQHFSPTHSQLRALKRAKRFQVNMGRPKVDTARLELHQAWHATREEHRGWDSSKLTEADYATQFSFPSSTGREMTWHDAAGKLVALGLVDVTANCLSAAYFFYSPDIARLSPGVGNVMLCVEAARELGCQHVYLGYRVLGCASLMYKGQFGPHEMLQGRPKVSEAPEWT